MNVVHRRWHGRVRRAPAWDCGFPLQTPRMQDTAEGFGQPIRQVFEPFFRMERHLPTPFDAQPRYAVTATDHFWNWLYVPIVRATDAVARFAGLIQRGRIAVYLTYSFVTLLALLLFVRSSNDRRRTAVATAAGGGRAATGAHPRRLGQPVPRMAAEQAGTVAAAALSD